MKAGLHTCLSKEKETVETLMTKLDCVRFAKEIFLADYLERTGGTKGRERGRENTSPSPH